MVLLDALKRTFYHRTVESLKNASAGDVIRTSEKKALETFTRARRLPFYKAFLVKKAASDISVADIASFRKHVPLSDKQSLYASELIPRALDMLETRQRASLLLSSGSTGTFSFGVQSQRQILSGARFLNVLLDTYFQILSRKTLIINALTSAVHLPVLDATVVEIGPRADSLIYLLKTVAPRFEQTILLGDNHFVKNALEDASTGGVTLSSLTIHLILGGIDLSESLRSHLKTVLKNKSLILSSMGISEFGVNLFFETPEIIRLRQDVETQDSLRQKVLGEDADFTPMFFNYFPQLFYIEDVEENLVVTQLSADAPTPLIRYNTQDKVKILSYEAVKYALPQNQTDRLPPFKSPLILVYGKKDGVQAKGRMIYPQQVQKGLYENFEVSLMTTGYFRLSQDGNCPHLDIQLKKGVIPSEILHRKFHQAVNRHLPVEASLTLYSFPTFPHGMDIDYERKFKLV